MASRPAYRRRLRKEVDEVQASGTTEAGTIFYSVLFDTGETYIGDLDLAAGTVRGLRLLPRPKGHTDGRPAGLRMASKC